MVETLEEQSLKTTVTETAERKPMTDEQAKAYILANVAHPHSLERESQKQVVRTIIPGSVYRVNFFSRVTLEGCMHPTWVFTNGSRRGDSLMLKLVAGPRDSWKLVIID